MTIRRGYVDVDAGQLHYRYAGDPDARALVLLHQSPSNSVMYESMMAALCEDYFVVAPDLPGFGNSDPLSGEVSVAGWAAAIEQALSALKISCCAVFGHHTGAAVAVQLAYNKALECTDLILSGPTLLSDAQKQALPAQASAFALDEEGSHLSGMWGRMAKKEAAAPLQLRTRETLLGLSLGDSYAAGYDAVIAHDLESLLPALDMPVLLMSGERDPLHSCVAPTLELLQRGTAVELGDTGSWCCDLVADDICRHLKEFLGDEKPAKAMLP